MECSLTLVIYGINCHIWGNDDDSSDSWTEKGYLYCNDIDGCRRYAGKTLGEAIKVASSATKEDITFAYDGNIFGPITEKYEVAVPS